MNLKINEDTYQFKTAFAEFTYSEFVPIAMVAQAPLMQRITAYTGIPADALNILPLANLWQVIELVQGLENGNLLMALTKPYEGTQVGLESYGKIETVKRRLKGRHLLEAAPDIVEIYTGQKIADEPLLDVWQMALFYIESVSKFFARYARLGEYQYTDEQLEAGVERFEGFGHFPNVVKIGRERGLTNDEVLALSAEEVYMELLLDFERGDFETALHKIHKEREEHFSKIK